MKAIVFVVDNAYADHLLLALRDIYVYSEGLYPIYVIFDHSLTIQNIKKIENFASKHGIPVKLTVIDRNWSKYVSKDIKHSRETHVSAITYGKVFIPALLPKEIKFAYYFDIDILIMRKIPDLFAIEPKAAIAATNHLHPSECERLLNEPGDYFNTGVFIANLDRWREKRITEKCMDIVERRPEDLNNRDQDALFIALHDDWSELPLIYNFFLMRFNPYLENYNRELDWDPKKIKPAIVHFAGPLKPWNAGQQANTFGIWRDRRKRL